MHDDNEEPSLGATMVISLTLTVAVWQMTAKPNEPAGAASRRGAPIRRP